MKPVSGSRCLPVAKNIQAAACFLGLAIACGTAATPAHSATPEETGLEIAKEEYNRKQGFENFTANQTMVLRNKQGRESKRQLSVRILEVEGDGNKVIYVFNEPRDVKGTAFLTHAHKTQPDDQWLYLPALKRVKRISSSNRSGSFMGSEFSYEDLGAQEVEKYTYRYLHDEPCKELTCSVTERIPAGAKSNYSHQLIWHDRDEFRTWKIEYYDRKGDHLKTLILDDYKQYLDRFWQSGKMVMTNHLTGKSTDIYWTDFEFQVELDEKDFTKTGLKRVR